MAFLPNIPQSTDQLSVSQGDILNNFTILGAIAGNTNPASSSLNATSGFNWVYLPPQGSIPPAGAAFPAANVGLYSAQNPTTSKNELYINKTNQATVVQIPATASVLSITSAPGTGTGGWTYLPSGLLIKFGSGTTAAGNSSFTFAATNPGAPAFTQVLTLIVTTLIPSTSDGNLFARAGVFTATGFNVYGSQRTTTTAAMVQFQFIAIGY